MSTRTRSHEPVFWSLFGAGGVVSALVLPVLIVITGIAVPLGLIPAEAMSYERMSHFAGSWLAKPILAAVIALPMWHAAHRVYHGAWHTTWTANGFKGRGSAD